MLIMAKLGVAQATDHKLSLDDIFKSNEFRTQNLVGLSSMKNGEHIRIYFLHVDNNDNN